MEELAYTVRLRHKLAGLKEQQDQLIANVNAIAGAVQFAEQELADQLADVTVKEPDHADGEQAT